MPSLKRALRKVARDRARMLSETLLSQDGSGEVLARGAYPRGARSSDRRTVRGTVTTVPAAISVEKHPRRRPQDRRVQRINRIVGNDAGI